MVIESCFLSLKTHIKLLADALGVQDVIETLKMIKAR